MASIVVAITGAERNKRIAGTLTVVCFIEAHHLKPITWCIAGIIYAIVESWNVMN
jgi:hypothetical protein